MAAGEIGAHEIAQRLNAAAPSIAPELLPRGRLSQCGRFWEAGSVHDGGAISGAASLKVNLKANVGCWFDFNAGANRDDEKGDMLMLAAATLFGGWSADGAKAKAIAWAKSRLGLDDLDPARLATVRREAAAAEARGAREAEREKAAKRRRAAALWNGAVPIRGTPAQAYLEGRGIDFGRLGRIPGSLRYLPDAWCPERGAKHPAMIACIMALSGELLGVHRTFLDLSAGKGGAVAKARIANAKLSLGHYAGGCIPLWKGASGRTLRDIEAGTPVHVSEGIEDGLTIALAFPERRVVAGVALANIGGLQLPPQAGPLVLIGQNDPIGSKAADAFERVVARQQEQGRAVQLLFPDPAYKDFNDQLTGKRMPGACAAASSTGGPA
ncbi:MAG TPA: toprim domain-containing protein [Allosphingosinicella sp.]|nr:toprim domain-containing protein [Allosphingosinicella sp.]